MTAPLDVTDLRKQFSSSFRSAGRPSTA